MYFFDDEDQKKKLKQILDEWKGTPYRHHCGVKKLGVDCIHFVGMILKEMGIVRWRKDIMPDYPRDWHKHNTRELLKDALEKEVKGEWIDKNDWVNNIELRKDGDVVLFHFGMAASHATIYFEGYLYQALERGGVCKINVDDKVMRRQMRYVYRVVK